MSDTVRAPVGGEGPARRELLGFFAHPGTVDDYLALLRRCVSRRERLCVYYHNQHTLYLYFRSESLRRCYAGAIVLADGMIVVFLGKLLGLPLGRDQRVTYVDFVMPLMRLARDAGWQVYHVGQPGEVQRRALERLRRELPGLRIDGRDGYFDQTPRSADSLEAVRRINEAGTDLLLVGFGTPRQEEWVHAHRELIDAPAVLVCGACMEYVAGAVRTPPRWLGRLGLEWSFRLLESPRRFGYRYTLQTARLLAELARRWIRARFTAPARRER